MEYKRKKAQHFKSDDERFEHYISISKLSNKTKKILHKLWEDRCSNKLKKRSSIQILAMIIRILECSKKDYNDMNITEDIKKYFRTTTLTSRQEEYQKRSISYFYAWLSKDKGDMKYMNIVCWINIKNLVVKNNQDARKKREDNLMKAEDLKKMVDTATNSRDKLAISMLGDCGCRAESIGCNYNKRSINIGQVHRYAKYAVIKNVEEKFGKRRDLYLTDSLPYLNAVWNEFSAEYRANPTNPLFVSRAGFHDEKHRWTYAGLKHMMIEVSMKALKRRVMPHDARHMVATRYAHMDLSDETKCRMMGWSETGGRNMLSKYTHATQEDAKNEFLVKKGIITLDEDKLEIAQQLMKPKQCLICDTINRATDVVCCKCGQSIDYEMMIKRHTENINNGFLPQTVMEYLQKIDKKVEALEKKDKVNPS